MGNLFHITSVLLWIVNPSNPTRGCIEHFSAWKELMYKTIWSLTMSLMSQSKKMIMLWEERCVCTTIKSTPVFCSSGFEHGCEAVSGIYQICEWSPYVPFVPNATEVSLGIFCEAFKLCQINVEGFCSFLFFFSFWKIVFWWDWNRCFQ